MQPNLSRLAIVSVLVVAADAHAQLPPELAGLDTQSRGPSQAGTRDCDKADAEQKAHFEAHMDDPQAAVLGGAKLGCTYLQRIAWKPPTAKKAPAAKPGKGAPSAADVARRAADFWAPTTSTTSRCSAAGCSAAGRSKNSRIRPASLRRGRSTSFT